jgi:hypothetical protein
MKADTIPGLPAIKDVSFWEDNEFVVDVFVLAKDSNDKKMHLYVREVIPLTGEDLRWKEFAEDFTCCNQINSVTSPGSWGHEGDYTRSVSTGSGLKGDRKTASPNGIFIFGHRDAMRYYIK